MGKKAAEMILTDTKGNIEVPFYVTKRASL
jgi:hypothetical protein